MARFKKRISCTGKARHKTRDNAMIAVKKLYDQYGFTAKAYKCRRCGFWHIGKPSFYDDPEAFWNNIFLQIDETEIQKWDKENESSRNN